MDGRSNTVKHGPHMSFTRPTCQPPFSFFFFFFQSYLLLQRNEQRLPSLICSSFLPRSGMLPAVQLRTCAPPPSRCSTVAPCLPVASSASSPMASVARGHGGGKARPWAMACCCPRPWRSMSSPMASCVPCHGGARAVASSGPWPWRSASSPMASCFPYSRSHDGA